MKIIARIKSPNEQSNCIANVYHDDRQTGEYLLQDAYSPHGYWFRTLTDLQDCLADIDFIKDYCRFMVNADSCLTEAKTYPICWYDETRITDRVNFLKIVKI